MRLSRLPTAVGLCASDTTGLTGYLNSAERRLLICPEAGDEGWWGSWAEMAFRVSRNEPYLTTPRNVARLEMVAACNQPVALHNQFYEYLRFGNGRMPKLFLCDHRAGLTEVYGRNNSPTFTDLSKPPQYIAVYLSDPVDVGARLLVQGKDAGGEDIYSMDGNARIKGLYVTVQLPFSLVNNLAGAPQPFSAITGIQKGGTVGYVQFQQVDPATGAQVLLHTMEPGETTGWYRRYYFNRLPWDCCQYTHPPSGCLPSIPPGQVLVTAIAKLDPVPVRFDTDYFVLQNAEALIEECQAIRYGSMDTTTGKAFVPIHHKNAVRLLNGELAHYMGKNEPAVEFAPFGTARLERQKIGTLI